MELKYIIKNEDYNLTINQILQSKLHISNRLRQQLIKEHLIFCNDNLCDTRNIANLGDVIKINFDNEEDGKKYIADHVLHNHETLPMGEFAIGYFV